MGDGIVRRKQQAVLLCVILVVACVAGCVTRSKNSSGGGGSSSKTATSPSPRGDTERLLSEIQDAIIAYTHTKKHPPKSLGSLQGRWDSERIRDAWGTDIAYSVGTDSTVRLWSFGADKQIGGAGDDADILVTFHPFSVPMASQKTETPHAVAGTQDDGKRR